MQRHLEITTYIGCPNKCEYCPQETLIHAYEGKKTMLLEDFKKILANTPPDIDIHFSGFSELFFLPNAVEFLKEAFKEHQVVVYTTTKGMTDETVEQIKDLPFKEFVVHERGSRDLPFATARVTITKENKISRAGHLWETTEHGGRCINSNTYEQNVVLPNGDVYLCCMDYGLKHKLGNLLQTNFNDLKRVEDYDLCRKCEKYR